MPGQQYNNTGKPYLRIVGGNIVQQVTKDHPDARHREYELRDGTKGEKWELVYMNWEGKINGITFKDTEYGEQCQIDFEDAILTLPTSGRYFTDFASKILNADLSQPVLLHPYDMEVDGKKRTGISVQQNEEKLQSYFWDGEKNINGFPEPDPEKKSKKAYWKIFFAEVEQFLIEKLTDIKFTEPEVIDEPYDEKPEEDPQLDDLPF